MKLLAGARFNHIGIPTTGRFEGEIDLPRLKVIRTIRAASNGSVIGRMHPIPIW